MSENCRWVSDGDKLGDALYYVHNTGTEHRVIGTLIIGNKDKEVTILSKRKKDTPYLVHSELCLKKDIPPNTDKSNIRYFNNDIIWFTVTPPIDGINRSVIVEMNESFIPLMKHCLKIGLIDNKSVSHLSDETKKVEGI